MEIKDECEHVIHNTYRGPQGSPGNTPAGTGNLPTECDWDECSETGDACDPENCPGRFCDDAGPAFVPMSIDTEALFDFGHEMSLEYLP